MHAQQRLPQACRSEFHFGLPLVEVRNNSLVAHDADGIVALLQSQIDRGRAIVADFVLGSPADTTRQEVS